MIEATIVPLVRDGFARTSRRRVAEASSVGITSTTLLDRWANFIGPIAS
jgi:hypothetical protein